MEHIQDEKVDTTVAMCIADCTAQFGVVRRTTPTCGIRTSHNNCVMMTSCKPGTFKKHVRKWGKRAASEEDVTRNYCAVVYGIFSNKKKPSTHHYTTLCTS